ncbi:sideroflexin-4 [Echinops telfairi]|uniref:Sideroflexin-4 n=1 Tax=Echinops telfairi TaxID=9371 RepID=A0AC55D6G6_ECHTE|nr:sideroflexin-4 [Echinops telfairi]
MMKSFVQRFLLWTELLDPTNLIISTETIGKARQLLSANAASGNVEEKQLQEAWKTSLSTVHPDSGKLIPAPFRPAAFLPFMGPLLFLSMMPSRGLKTMILPQFSLYTYLTSFNIVNGNTSYHDHPRENLLLGAGVIASSTFLGETLGDAAPAQISAVSVLASRSPELAQGIKVMDKEGNVVGHSRRAGEKAIKETALSRMVLFGASACVPEVVSYFFKRTQFFLQHSLSLWAVRLSCSYLALGLMVPVSFSMFPQVRQIQCSGLEAAIQSSTQETELFYHRGV